jgi:hypothetical protein
MSRKRCGHLQFQKPVKHARGVALLGDSLLHARHAALTMVCRIAFHRPYFTLHLEF